MPFVTVALFAGRSREQKEKLAKAITEAFVAHAGNREEDVQIVFQDVDKGDWAKAGVLYDTPEPR